MGSCPSKRRSALNVNPSARPKFRLDIAAWRPSERWTIFARGEAIETDELDAHHGPIEDVQRISLGAIRDFRLNESTVIGIGALLQQHFASEALAPSYGGDPQGAMAFVRLRIG